MDSHGLSLKYDNVLDAFNPPNGVKFLSSKSGGKGIPFLRTISSLRYYKSIQKKMFLLYG